MLICVIPRKFIIILFFISTRHAYFALKGLNDVAEMLPKEFLTWQPMFRRRVMIKANNKNYHFHGHLCYDRLGGQTSCLEE